MNDIVTHLEAALDQARQELAGIQRAGRALAPGEDARVTHLQRVTALVQAALDALCQTPEPQAAEPSPERGPAPADGERGPTGGGATGSLFDGRDLEMSQGGLAGIDDTDDY